MRDNTMKFSVTPSLDFENGAIYLEMRQQFAELQEQVTKAMIQTRDEAVKKSLVALGWTPPPELPVENEDGLHHFQLIVKTRGSRQSAMDAVLYAFASRSPDGCSFHLQP